jgi:hypothetical protein
MLRVARDGGGQRTKDKTLELGTVKTDAGANGEDPPTWTAGQKAQQNKPVKATWPEKKASFAVKANGAFFIKPEPVA